MPLGIALNAIRSLKSSLQGFVSILGGYLGYSDLPLRTGGLLISSNYDIDSNNNIYFSPDDGKIYKIFSDTKEIIPYFNVGSVVKIIIKNDDLFFLGNNVSSYSIKKISNGILSTIGTIASSRTIVVSDFVIDSTGNFFVTFYENSLGNLGQTDTHCVYKVYGDKSKLPEIFIGGNVGFNDYNPITSPIYSGSDYTRFTNPTKIQIDSSDNLYVYDSGNGYIKKITPNKILTRHLQLRAESIIGYTIDSNDYLYVINRNASYENFLTIDTKTPARSNTLFNRSYNKTNSSSNINPIYSDSTPLKSRGFVQSFNILKDGNAYFTEDIGVSTYQKCLVKFNFNDYITNNIFNSEKIFFNPVNSPSNTKKYATGLSTGLVKGLCFNSNNDLFFSDESTHTIRKISSDNSKVIPIGGFVGLSGLNDGIIGKRGFIESNSYNTIFWNNNSLLVSSRGTSAGLTPIGIKSISFTNNTINTIYKTIPAPTCIVKDTSGNLFILTISSGIFKVDTLGNITTFSNVVGHRMVIDSSNNLFVYNYLGGTIVFEIYKISSAGVSTTFKTRTQITSLMMQGVQGMCIDSVNNIYMSDGSTVLKLTSSGVDSIIYGPVGLANGRGMCIDPSDNIYVCDYNSKCIVKILPNKTGSIYAGSPDWQNPSELAYDPNANEIYILGTNEIRKVTLNTKTVTKLYSDLGRLPYQIYNTTDGLLNTSVYNTPRGLCIDSTGNTYVCDYGNNKIRKITPQGVTSTVASISYPIAITIDSSRNLFVTRSNRTYSGVKTNIFAVIYKVVPSTGVVSVFAGIEGGYISPDNPPIDGTGIGAKFSDPSCICIDYNDNLYVGDEYSIRKITPAGVVTRLAGDMINQGDVDGIPSKLGNITGLVYHPSDKLYFIDKTYGKIKVIDLSTNAVATLAGSINYTTTEGKGKVAYLSAPLAIALNTQNELIITTSDYRFVKYSI